jgi:alpha-beta hydrolase superfamily lysophospholipase
MRGTGTRLARAGYAVYGVDYEGHGRSEGLQGYVPSFDVLVADLDAFFAAVVASTANTELPRFLLGESMGGAVALLLHRARPSYWTGAVLVAPMCKVQTSMHALTNYRRSGPVAGRHPEPFSYGGFRLSRSTRTTTPTIGMELVARMHDRWSATCSLVAVII